MHGDAGAVRDVLARHVLDIRLERVDVRHAGIAAWSAGPGSARPCAVVFASPAHHRRLRLASSLDRSDELPAVPSGKRVRDRPAARLPAGDRVHVHVAGRAGIGAPNRYWPIPTPFTVHRPSSTLSASVTSTRKSGPAVRRHEERRPHRLLVRHLVVRARSGLVAWAQLFGLLRLRLVALEDGAHRVVAEACLRPAASSSTPRCSSRSPCTVRSSTTRSWPSRTEHEHGVPAGSSRMPCGVLWRRMALKCTSSPSR